MSSRGYRHFQQIDYLADLIGADVAADLLKVRIEQAETPLDINNDSPLDVTAAALEIGTWSAGTLPVEQQTPVTIEDIQAWNAGVLSVQEDTSLDVSGATVPVDQQGVVDISSRDARNLGDVDVIDLPDNDHQVENGTSLASGGSVSTALAARGAEQLHGKVTREMTSYDVTVEWLDAPGGTALFTTSVATGVAAGTETTIDETTLYSPYMNIIVADAGSGSGAVTATYNLA